MDDRDKLYQGWKDAVTMLTNSQKYGQKKT